MRLVVLGGGESGVGTAILGRKKDDVLYLILKNVKTLQGQVHKDTDNFLCHG
jgi:hypothetical protein